VPLLTSYKSYNLNQVCKLFSLNKIILKEELIELERKNYLPKRKFINKQKVWTTDQLPNIGKQIGFLPQLETKKVITSFVTKGGVLKTTLTYNLARILALHKYKVCVIGLDIQGDISNILTLENLSETEDINNAIDKLNSLSGLYELKEKKQELKDVIEPSDISNLNYIPETPELVKLDQSLLYLNRREYWLKEKVVSSLLKDFDFVIIDCPPNWNNLITNALVSTDLLLSPIECKINNFRNFQMFQSLIHEFKKDFNLQFEHIYIPTKFSQTKRLSRDIYLWYQNHIESMTNNVISESLQGEEASALKISLPEYHPSHKKATEMKSVISECLVPFYLEKQIHKHKELEL
jgi:chromosome partitioning protein